MKDVKVSERRKPNGLVVVLYIIAAVLAGIFVYMAIANGVYIKNYLASYGMSFADMWMDSVQYVITGSVSYLVYAVLVFCAGKIISMLSRGSLTASAVETEADGKNEMMETVDSQTPDGMDEPPTVQPETAQADEPLTAQADEPPQEEADGEGSQESMDSETDIPESEDAIEKTEVIEAGDSGADAASEPPGGKPETPLTEKKAKSGSANKPSKKKKKKKKK